MTCRLFVSLDGLTRGMLSDKRVLAFIFIIITGGLTKMVSNWAVFTDELADSPVAAVGDSSTARVRDGAGLLHSEAADHVTMVRHHRISPPSGRPVPFDKPPSALPPRPRSSPPPPRGTIFPRCSCPGSSQRSLLAERGAAPDEGDGRIQLCAAPLRT